MANLDPNLIATLGGALVALATWAYHKVRGDKHGSIADIASDLVDQALHFGIVSAEENIDAIRAKATTYALQGLARLGVPSNTTTRLIVAGAVEAGITEALRLAREHARYVEGEITKSLSMLKATLPAKIEDFAKPPATPTIPNILASDENMTVELREPDRAAEYHPAFPVR